MHAAALLPGLLRAAPARRPPTHPGMSQSLARLPPDDHAAGPLARQGPTLSTPLTSQLSPTTQPPPPSTHAPRPPRRRFHQQIESDAGSRWVLCQASFVQHPASGEPCVVLTQVDVSEDKQVGGRGGPYERLLRRDGTRMGMHARGAGSAQLDGGKGRRAGARWQTGGHSCMGRDQGPGAAAAATQAPLLRPSGGDSPSTPPAAPAPAPTPPAPAQMSHAHAAAAERAHERMEVLQRKLMREITESEALRHVVDRLQAQVLALRRQMQVRAAGRRGGGGGEGGTGCRRAGRRVVLRGRGRAPHVGGARVRARRGAARCAIRPPRKRILAAAGPPACAPTRAPARAPFPATISPCTLSPAGGPNSRRPLVWPQRSPLTIQS